jgi:hypothetical protein
MRTNAGNCLLWAVVVAWAVLPNTAKAQTTLIRTDANDTQKSASPLVPGVTTGNYLNPLQVALRSWYRGSQSNNFSVGRGPNSVAFDGANIWVTNQGGNSVSKLALVMALS